MNVDFPTPDSPRRRILDTEWGDLSKISLSTDVEIERIDDVDHDDKCWCPTVALLDGDVFMSDDLDARLILSVGASGKGIGTTVANLQPILT